MNAVIFLASFILGLPIVWAARGLGMKLGRLDEPRPDRWHQQPTPKLGGIAVFCVTFLGVGIALFSGLIPGVHWSFLAVPVWMFLLGLVDDLHPLSPALKLLGQIIAATFVVFIGGFLIQFFPWPVANVLLTVFWLVGITNAINLLDNMDGLAGGVAFIAAGIISLFSYIQGDQGLLTLSLILAGSVLAFLCFNFPPAKIFMGDSGSMFIGFALAELAVARRTTASNMLAVMGVPILVLLLPILDTTLVTVTRLLRGQSPAHGGRDHSSHRLVSFGLSERQAILVLYGVALISGVAGVALEALDYDLSLALIPCVLIILALFTSYLGKVRIITPPSQISVSESGRLVQHVLQSRAWELLLDLGLVSVCYYLAFWVRYGFDMIPLSVELFLRSWPVVLLAVYSLNYVCGVYRAMWSSYTVLDLIRHALSSCGSALTASIILHLVYLDLSFPLGVFVLFSIFFFIALAGTRSSFVILDQLLYRMPSATLKTRVLLYDASNSSEVLLRLMERSPEMEYLPVGILDPGKQQKGRYLRGVPILGWLNDLRPDITRVDGVLVSNPALLENAEGLALMANCRKVGLWVRLVHLEFELLE